MGNENLNQTKEIMIKRCRTFGNILRAIKWVAIVLSVVLIAGIGTMIYWTGEEIDTSNELIGENNIVEESIESDQEEIPVEGFASLLGLICSFVLIDSLGKVFLNIAKEETPFAKNIIKSIKDICVFSTIIWFIGLFSPAFNMGLVCLLIIWAMYYIFKYGYQLQLESDETL